MIVLRPRQEYGVHALRATIEAGARRVIAVAPTGFGKTLVACHITDSAVGGSRRVVILAHKIDLVDQMSRKLDEFQIPHGVIQADHWRREPWRSVQVASVPTLINRERLPEADVLIVDECHHTTSTSFQSIVRGYPEAVVLGLTATPYRTDGRGLGEDYQAIVTLGHLDEVIDEGFLVPPRTFAPMGGSPDLRGVHTVRGDYNKRELASAMDKPQLIGDIVKTWFRFAEGRPTLVFAVSVEHSRHIVERFIAAGVAAEHVDAETPIEERWAAIRRLEAGETKIISNVGILCEGSDIPAVSCVVLARPTQSRCVYRQQVGRGLRILPGEDVIPWNQRLKVDCIVLDHAGNSLRHGLVTDREEYSLQGVVRTARLAALAAVWTCLVNGCYGISPASSEVCLHCGAPRPKKRRILTEKPGELQETGSKVWAKNATVDQRVRKLADWIHETREKKYSPGRPFAIYRGMFKEAPSTETMQAAKDLAAAELAQGAR